MADFPVVNFAQYQWEVNDQNYLTKWNNFQTAVTALQNSINAFGEEVTTEKQAAADSAQEASESAALAEQYRNEAQQIAAGDVAITDLLPGALSSPGDYAGPDGSGGLMKRNILDDTLARSHAIALSF